MPKGKKYGGRKKGIPNKINSQAREVFKRVFDGLAPEVEGWIRAEAEKGNEGKAAELTLKLAQHFVPKMPLEVTGKDGAPLLDFGVDLGRAKE